MNKKLTDLRRKEEEIAIGLVLFVFPLLLVICAFLFKP